ncbi:MAG: gliding motility-associated C-terminal domain-containing protein [Saprospiraceae bacterium]
MKELSFYCTLILTSILYCSFSSLAEEKTTLVSTAFPTVSEYIAPASPLNDSLALVAIYNATGGSAWSISWNLSAPINTWNGITFNGDGCVTELFLDNNNLTGSLPPEIGNLSQLEILHLDNNQLTGSLPPEIGNLAQLEIAFLDDNDFTGSIPNTWGNLNKLITLFLDNNMLSGAVPIEFASLDNLQNFDFFNNNIDSLPDLTLVNTLQPNKFRVFGNQLSFDDILPNLGAPLATNYAPQDSFLTKTTVTVSPGTNYDIDLGIDEGISSNVYQWFKDGFPYTIGNSHKLNFPSITFGDAGTYWCTVTNPNAPLLTLHSRCVTINVGCTIVLGTYMPTLCPGESIEIGGITYNASNPAGNDFLPGASQAGCDSLTNIQILFYDPISFDFDALLCTGDTIVVNGNSYHQGNPTGTEVLANAAANGCDSTVNIDLTFITPVSSGSLTQVICPGDNLEINGTNYNQANPSGTEILANAAFNGCDSIVMITLSFHPVSISYFHRTFCTGEEVIINGTAYNESNPSGVEVLANQSYLSCDSIVDIELSFDAAVTFDLTTTLCEGESVSVNGTTYDQGNPTGTENMPNASYLGCDSIVNVNLSFYLPTPGQLMPALCVGESIVINGVTYNASNPSGIQTLTGEALFGCDSTLQIDLVFLALPTHTIETNLCEGESIVVNGVTYNQSNPIGMETLTGAAANGCDSLIMVDLNFYPAATELIQTTLCEADSLIVNGTIYHQSNPSGTEIITNGSYTNCDSIVQIDLSFHPAAINNIEQLLCDGENLIVNGTTYNEANPTGTEILNGQSFRACDSTIVINLSFHPAATTLIQTTLCAGESMTINGTVYDETNSSDIITLNNASFTGCDSTITVNLSFYPVATSLIQTTFCGNESIVVNGNTYNNTNPSGVEVLSNASFTNCDSTITIDLNFLNPSTTTLAETLCAGSTRIVNGTTYNEANPSGVETILNGAVNGCDSIITVNLSFYDPAINNLNAALCEGASLLINNVIYNEANPSGTEVIPSGNWKGCDSTIVVNLIFTQEATGDFTPTLCQGESVIVNGTLYDQANPTGTETIINGSFFGCDSVINVSLNFLTPATFDYQTTLCAEASVVINGTIYNQTNPTGVEVLANANYLGCDSTINVNLDFYAAATTTLTTSLCANESLTINGTIYNATNPTGTEILANASFLGCDSTITVALNFYAVPIGDFSPQLCAGESVVVNGMLYNEANPTGNTILNDASYLGCDSTVNVNLSFYPPAMHEIEMMLCNGASIVVNGTIYNQANPSGTEILSGASFRNCDSIITIDLDFQSQVVGNFTPTLCADETLVINGTTYDATNPTGSELMINGSFLGCDSLTNIALSFYPAVQTNLNQTLCATESITVNGTIYNQANPTGVEILENASFLTCDSTVNINLSFLETSTTLLNETICEGNNVVINGVAYAESGTFTETLINGSSNGCDSVISLVLTVISPTQLPSANVGEDLNSCEDAILLQGNQPATTTGNWSSLSTAILENPTQTTTMANNLITGENRFIWTLSTDVCPDYTSDTLVVQREQVPITNDDQIEMDVAELSIDISIAANDVVDQMEDWEINILTTPPFGEVQVVGEELRYTRAADFSGTVSFDYEICNANCPELCSSAQVRIFIPTPPPSIDSSLVIPNGITPNNDGINDVFMIPQLEFHADQYPNNELVIYNRWGAIVYEAKPYLNDWGGTNKQGKALPQGTYYYLLRLDITAGEILRGDISILKN